MNYYEQKRSNGIFAITLGIILLIPAVIYGIGCFYNSYQFDIKCGDYLKQAADANIVETAKERLGYAIEYLDRNNIVSGNTAVIFKKPSNDVGFWVKNLKDSYDELSKVKPESTLLERTNVLMKLRETLVDHGSSSVRITHPDGISLFPNNGAWLIFFWVVLLLGIAGVLLIVFGVNNCN